MNTTFSNAVTKSLVDAFISDVPSAGEKKLSLSSGRSFFVVKNLNGVSKERIEAIIAKAKYMPLSLGKIEGNYVFTVVPYQMPILLFTFDAGTDTTFPQVTSKREKPASLDAQEQSYIGQLSCLDLKSGEKKCKEIGQTIFDYYKAAAGGDSFAGKKAVQKICDAIHYNAADGKSRADYIERAWDGIGDDKWTWMA